MFTVEFLDSRNRWRPVPTGYKQTTIELAEKNTLKRRASKGNEEVCYRVRDGIEIVRFWPPYGRPGGREWDGRNLGPFAKRIDVPFSPPIKAKIDLKAGLKGVLESDLNFSGGAAVNPASPSKAKLRKASSGLPQGLRKLSEEIALDPSMSEPMRYIMERESQFSTPTAAMLAGIALDEKARMAMDAKIDEIFASFEPKPVVEPEIVVGGGLHAAIYCAVRVAMGAPPPLVLEMRERAGGVFACSRRASFYLNSRNRPGNLSVPGTNGALNVLPGAPVQPSDLGGEEYQTNDALAWVIRMTLAMNARVQTGATISSVERIDGQTEAVFLVGGGGYKANRVIVSTGLTNPKQVFPNSLKYNGKTVLGFEQLMAKMDEPFPLRGMRRVAVVGGGDSGKTAIETLTGKGPRRGYSVASLDYVETIDWYGAKQTNRTDWINCNRTRYKSIASLLPISLGIPSRVNPKPKAEVVSEGYACAYVNDIPYDCVIVCVGYDELPTPAVGADEEYISGGRKLGKYRDNRIVVGPASAIPLSDGENVNGIVENGVALYRYAARTAQLANGLPLDPPF